MATLTPGQSGHDIGRKFVNEGVKRWAEKTMSSPEQVAFVVDLMDGAYELVVLSSRNGGTLSNADVVAFMKSRALTFGGLSDSSMLQCAIALIDLGETAVSYSRTVAVPVVGWTVYASMMALDGLTAGGECYLAYQDRRIETQVREFQKQLSQRKAWAKSNAALAVRSPTQIARDLHNMLEWQDRQPKQCVMPATQLPVPRLP